MRIADKIRDSLPDQPHKNLKTFQMKQFLEVLTILQIIFLKLYGYEWWEPSCQKWGIVRHL